MGLRHPDRELRMLAVALWSLALPGCSSTAPWGDGLRQSELSANQRKWAARHITSYRYTVRRVCFCAPPVTRPAVVTVRDGAVRSAVYADDGSAVPDGALQYLPTVEQLFATIREAIDRNPDELAVTYDPALGYPREIRIDGSKRVADDELTITASGLQPE